MEKNLKAIRKKQGLGQLDIALRAGCGISTVSLIERGYASRISPELKRRIAHALRCRVEDVFPEAEMSRISKKRGGTL